MYDAHLHFGDTGRLGELIRYCSNNALAGAALVSLPSPGWINFNPEVLYAKYSYPEKFWAFAALEHEYPARRSGSRTGNGLASPDLGEQVRELREIGCDGIKVWSGKPSFQKLTGLTIDGPEFSELYSTAAEVDMPVLLHAADPLEFWEHDYAENGEWKDFEAYLAQAETAVAEHPDTTFIFPHLLFLAQDLQRLRGLLDDYPNMCLDISPGMYYFSHLSAQGNAAVDFFDEYAGRIMFGTDIILFPTSYSLLPHMDEDLLYQRFSLLNDFFFRGASVADPFQLAERGKEMLSAPMLSEKAHEGLRRAAFLRLFKGGTPRQLDFERLKRYLGKFPRSHEFTMSEIR